MIAVARTVLPGGRAARIHVARPEDAAAVAELHEHCSPRALRDHYRGPALRLTTGMLRHLVAPGYGVSVLVRSLDGQVLGMARLAAESAAPVAELCVLVRDDHQRGGLGSELVRTVARAGLDRGLVEFHGSGSADNCGLLGLLRRLGLHGYTQPTHDGRLIVRAPLGVLVETGTEADDFAGSAA